MSEKSVVKPSPADAIGGTIASLRDLAPKLNCVLNESGEHVSTIILEAVEQIEIAKRHLAVSPALLDALVTALPYVTDAEGFPEQFKPGVVAGHVHQIRAAIDAAEKVVL